MSDRWTDRLSEYLDGELGADEARELEAHLASCAGCREVLADLRRIVGGAAALRDREPEAELWAGIERRIREEPPQARVVALFDAKRERRRVSFSVPQLLAAGLVLALASAGSVWLALRGGPQGVPGPATVAAVQVTRDRPAGAERLPAAPDPQGSGSPAAGGGESGLAPTPAARGDSGAAASAPRAGRALPRRGTPAAQGPQGSARFAGYEDPAYDAAVADLQAVLEQGRDRLDPRTVQVLEESLGTIDAAIEDARRALAADPANARLNTYLAGTRQRKLELLREASDIVTAIT
jgi:tetratricopeptide (TPR) repeat protein